MKHRNLGKLLGIALATACVLPGMAGTEEATELTAAAAEAETETEVETETEAVPEEAGTQADLEKNRTDAEKEIARRELEAALKKLENAETTSLLSEYLGTEAIKESIAEKGFEFMTSWGLQEGTLETLGMDPGIFEEPYANLGLMWDPAEKRWSFSVGGGLSEEASLSAWVYGDTEKLLLGCEPFYDGAIGINSGSFLDQYVGSALEELLVSLLDAPDISGIPDFDLMFYPENIDLSAIQRPAEEIGEKFLEKYKEMEENLLVESEVFEDGAAYYVACETEQILEFYQVLFNELIALSLDTGAMDYEAAMETNEEILTFMEDAKKALGENITMYFMVDENGLISSIAYSLSIMDETYSYGEDGEATEPEIPETVLSCAIDFADPADPWNTFDVIVDVWKMDDPVNTDSIWLTKQTETTDTLSETTLSLMVKENEEVLYWGIPYSYSFNAENGDLDMTISMTEDENVAITLDSSFTDVVPGESFVWNMDGLTMEVEGEAIGLTGNVKVSAGVKNSYEPENVVMLCEATQGELFTVMNQAMMNAQEWLAQFQPETEAMSVPESETEDAMNY